MRIKSYNIKHIQRKAIAGFSMIEVLVASAILTIIVMMMGMLFQQTSLAWRVGSKRADAFLQVRSLVGAIQRDASQAVDQYGAEIMRSESLSNQEFSETKLRFYTVSGKERTLSRITYDNEGFRQQDELNPKTGKWDEGEKYNVMTTINKQTNPNKPDVHIEFDVPKKVKDPYNKQTDKCLPLYVLIKATVTPHGYGAEIGAASAGPDRKWGNPDDKKNDDITSWSRKN